MIYLIGGPPKCGKTTLSKQLAKSQVIPWISTDALQNSIKPYVPKEEFDQKFPSSAAKYKTNDELYAKHSQEELILAYRTQAKTLFPAISAFVESEILDGNDFIVEGLHVEPELIAELEKKYPGSVRGLIVIKKDVEAYTANIRKSTTPHDWIVEKTKQKETYTKIAEMVSSYSRQIETEANNLGITVFNLDQEFSLRLRTAIDFLVLSDQ